MVDELDDLLIEDVHMYEVWAIGYDCNDKPTEFDYLLYTAVDPDDAITFADSVTSFEVKAVEADALIKADHFSIEVETTAVIDDEPMNLGTIYRRSLYYNSMTADLMLTSSDYQVQDDGSLLIANRFLSKLKDKETINALFLDNGESSILTIKIIKELNENTFLCELVF
jgi:hypothetical protein